MANYDVRVWSNTGFNSINIPDSPNLLNSLPSATYPALDLLQNRFLSSIRIRATFDQVKNADFCKLGDFYYFVDGVTMTSGDVAMLGLIPDFITSAGGAGSLTILDGVTSRVHVTDDTYGKYTEPDPLTVPSEALKVVVDDTSVMFSGTENQTVVDSALNLIRMGQMYDEDESIYGDATNPGAMVAITGDEVSQVTFPTVIQNTGGTTYYINGGVGASNTELPPEKNASPIRTYDATNANVKKGIQAARALGVEGAVSNMYNLPRALVTAGINPATGATDGVAGNIVPKTTSIPFSYATVKNNRVMYGENTPFGILSGNGSKAEFNAERIYDGSSTHPTVLVVADPRIDGKPYFRFQTLDGVVAGGNNLKDFFRNCINGRDWYKTPVIYREKSGRWLDSIKFASNMAINEYSFEQGMRNMQQQQVAAQTDAAFATANFLSSAKTAKGAPVTDADGKMLGTPNASLSFTGGMSGNSLLNFGKGFSNMVSNMDSVMGDVMGYFGLGYEGMAHGYAKDRSVYKIAYQMQKGTEMLQYYTAQNCWAPTVEFPMTADLFNDIMGCGAVVYRYEYKDSDIAKIDKLLTMYGYKYSKPLEASDFSNRQYFNYVEGSITVGNLPRWWAEGVAAQVGTGVRVWHVKPNPSYYTNNPVR